MEEKSFLEIVFPAVTFVTIMMLISGVLLSYLFRYQARKTYNPGLLGIDYKELCLNFDGKNPFGIPLKYGYIFILAVFFLMAIDTYIIKKPMQLKPFFIFSSYTLFHYGLYICIVSFFKSRHRKIFKNLDFKAKQATKAIAEITSAVTRLDYVVFHRLIDDLRHHDKAKKEYFSVCIPFTPDAMKETLSDAEAMGLLTSEFRDIGMNVFNLNYSEKLLNLFSTNTHFRNTLLRYEKECNLKRYNEVVKQLEKLRGVLGEKDCEDRIKELKKKYNITTD